MAVGFFRRMAFKALALSLPEPLRTLILEQMASVPNGSYKQYVDSGYKGNPYVSRSVRWVAGNGGRIKLRPYVLAPDGSRTPAPPTHPLAVTMRRPNPLDGQARFQERYLTQLCLSGDAYILGVASSDTTARMELYTRRPDWIKVIPGTEKRLIDGYKYDPQSGENRKKETYKPEEMCHIYLPDPVDDLDGMSMAAPAWRSILQSNAAGVWNYNLLTKGARPTLAWETPPGDEQLTPTQFAEAEKRINEKYSGADNAGKAIVVSGFQVKPIGLSPAEMEHQRSVITTMREIAMAFGVPSVLLSDVENATYSNMQTAIRLLYELTIFPLMDIIADDLTAWFAPRYGDEYVIGYETKDVSVLQETASEKWGRVQDARFLTMNQKLTELGYTDIGKAGEVYILSPADMPVTADGLLEMATAAADVVTATDDDESEPGTESGNDEGTEE